MNENFILLGTFNFDNVIIKDFKASFQHGGLFITIAKPDAKQHFVGVQIDNVGTTNIALFQRMGAPVKIKGSIYKNPNTERILYIVDDANKDIAVL